VSITDGLPDQIPGAVPPPGTFTRENEAGNTVLLALGDGSFALYGNLQPGSIIVTPGTYVRAGQPIAQIGNSGNGEAPHLSFQLMSSSEVLGAEGKPFVLSSFSYAGAIDPAGLARFGLAGQYAADRAAAPESRQRQLPLALSIVDFEQSSGGGGNPLV
jgi:murein DD-endopeptidase MepM/ murein hydrolase activator NlpD